MYDLRDLGHADRSPMQAVQHAEQHNGPPDCNAVKTIATLPSVLLQIPAILQPAVLFHLHRAAVLIVPGATPCRATAGGPLQLLSAVDLGESYRSNALQHAGGAGPQCP